MSGTPTSGQVMYPPIQQEATAVDRAALVALALGLGLVAPSTARADLWQHAIAAADPNVVHYAPQLAHGDDLASKAMAVNQSVDSITRNLDAALTAYRTAAELSPSSGEPYYRIGKLLDEFALTGCRTRTRSTAVFFQPGGPTVADLVPARPHALAEQILQAWAETSRPAPPLDPRLTSSFLFERAILHTKLGTCPH